MLLWCPLVLSLFPFPIYNYNFHIPCYPFLAIRPLHKIGIAWLFEGKQRKQFPQVPFKKKKDEREGLICHYPCQNYLCCSASNSPNQQRKWYLASLANDHSNM